MRDPLAWHFRASKALNMGIHVDKALCLLVFCVGCFFSPDFADWCVSLYGINVD